MSQFQFIKSIDQINDVAIFIDNLIKDHKIQFVLLEGQIGSGKSTLVRALAQLWNNEKVVPSPSFNKMLIYDQFIHIDAYNMKANDLEQLMDYFEDKIVLIEWANLLNYDFEHFIKIKIAYQSEFTRLYLIELKE